MTNTKTDRSSTLTPLQEAPLPEAATAPELRTLLERMHVDDLPGFVIRAADLVDPAVSDGEEVDDMVVATLSELTGLRYGRGASFDFRDKPKGAGHLHDDGTVNPTQIQLHETVHGAGKVWLANSGRRLKEANEAYADDAFLEAKHALHEHVLSGQTDPDFMSPEVHTTDLERGDKVVFRLSNSQGPVWHRFDTTTASRTARATVIEPVDQPPE